MPAPTGLALAIAGSIAASSAPWLQNVTPNSAVLMWLAEKPGYSTLQYGTAPNMGQTTQSKNRRIEAASETSDKPYILHEIELRGLSPATQYFYQVAGQKPHTFTTASQGQEAIRFAVTSNPNALSPGKAQQTWKAITAAKPEFVVISGDISNKSLNTEYAQFWSRGQPLAASVPVYTVQGNHDGRVGSQYTQWVNNETVDRFNEKFYAFDRGPAHFVMVNDGVDEGVFRIERFPTGWFQSALRKRERRHNIVVMNGNFRKYASMQKVIDANRGNIDVVITSGSGRSYTQDGIRWIEVGGSQYAYALVTINGDAISVEVRKP